jgi:ABC-2 type transport system permease protein
MKFQHLYKRELLSFVATPIAWVVGFVFLLVPAFMFLVTDGFIASGQASLRGYFDWIPLMFGLIVPALTMRSWAEEQDKGSLDLLLTLPLKPWEFVFAKFLSVFTVLGGFILLTLPMVLMVLPLGDFDLGEIFSEYLGTFFLAGTTVSLGVLISYLTQNQIIALVLGVIAILSLNFIGQLPTVVDWLAPVGDFFRFFSFEHRFQSFHRGLIDSRDVVYLGSLTFLFLYINTLALSDRKWR